MRRLGIALLVNDGGVKKNVVATWTGATMRGSIYEHATYVFFECMVHGA